MLAAGQPKPQAVPVLTSAALAAVLAVVLTVVLAGRASAPRGSTTTVPPRPQELQADAVATQEFGLLSGGGWAKAWDLWSTDAQQTISQADFVRLNQACRPVIGTPYRIGATTRVDQDTVRVDWRRADTTGSNTLVYQGDAWRFVPDTQSMTDYRLAVTALVQKRKAAGSCH